MLPRNCTFTESDWRTLAACWHPVAFADEVKDKPLARVLLDEQLVVFRTAKGVCVAKDLCIHRGSPLSLGWVQGDEIVCAYHGFATRPTGAAPRCPRCPTSRSRQSFA